MIRLITHTNQYLSWDSNHPSLTSVVRSLTHGTDTVISDPNDRESEYNHMKTALKKCGYPEWALKTRPSANRHDISEVDQDKKFVAIPYVKGLSEII